MQQTFFAHFFAVPLHGLKRETSFNFLFTRYMVDMLKFLFTLFFHCRSISL